MSEEEDVETLARDYLEASESRKQQLQVCYPEYFSGHLAMYFRSFLSAFQRDETNAAGMSTPGKQIFQDDYQSTPQNAVASVPAFRSSTRKERTTELQEMKPLTMKAMKTVCRSVRKVAKRFLDLTSMHDRRSQKMLKELRLKGKIVTLPSEKPTKVARKSVVKMDEILQRIEEEMNRVGARLTTADGIQDVSEDASMLATVIHDGVEMGERYYHQIHKNGAIFPSFPGEAFLPEKTLRPFQWEGVQWLSSLHANNLNGILADEMGLGKTVQIVAFLTCLRYYKNVRGPHIIIAPLSVLPNWAMEFGQWTQLFKVATIADICETGLSLDEVDVLIVHYEFLRKPGTSEIKSKVFRAIKKRRFSYLIADEGHALKNKEALTFKKLEEIHAEHRIILTGTPLQNNLQEVFTLLNFVMPQVFHTDCDNLQKIVALYTDSVSSDADIAPVIMKIHQLLRPFMLRREVKDVANDIPKTNEIVVICKLSPLQQKQIAMFRKHYHKLRKIALHPYMLRNEYELDDQIISSSGKLEAMDIILRKLMTSKVVHKVIIFALWTTTLDIIESYFEHRMWLFVRIDGNINAKKRQEILQDFQTNDMCRFILISKRAGGFGLNLQVADTVILYDTDYNPTNDLQAMARVCRIGQRSEVRLLRLICEDNLEGRIQFLADNKRRGEALVINAAVFDPTSTTDEKVQELEEALESTSINRVECSMADLNEHLARSHEEKEAFDEFDKALQEEADARPAAETKKRIRFTLPNSVQPRPTNETVLDKKLVLRLKPTSPPPKKLILRPMKKVRDEADEDSLHQSKSIVRTRNNLNEDSNDDSDHFDDEGSDSTDSAMEIRECDD